MFIDIVVYKYIHILICIHMHVFVDVLLYKQRTSSFHFLCR